MDIHVLFCFDEKYQQHFGVALTSLLVNNQENFIHAHLLTKDITLAFQEKLSDLKFKYKFSYSVYVVSEEEISDLPISRHISLAAYYRLLAPKVLPENLNKILYLDSDLVVNGSINDLYSIPLSDKPLAAVGGRVITTKARLDLAGDYYFNSGVMLINLNTWKERSISECCFDFLANNPHKAKFWDQDALNKIIDGEFVFLDKKWNTLVDLNFSKESLPHESVVLHYVGSLKPWQIWCLRPNKKYYWKYLRVSPWKTALPEFPRNMRKVATAINSLKKQLWSKV